MVRPAVFDPAAAIPAAGIREARGIIIKRLISRVMIKNLTLDKTVMTVEISTV
jgi:hypothetical protein